MRSQMVKSFQAEKDIFSPKKYRIAKPFTDSFSSSTQLTYPK